jgi:hypothetical protein
VLLAGLLLVVSVGACAWRQPDAELSLLYNDAAQHHGPDRNPIIATPGLMGSRLLDAASGVSAWGAFEPGAANPSEPNGARTIALPIRDEELANLRDEVETASVLENVRIKLVGVPFEIQAYAGILATLGASGYRDEAFLETFEWRGDSGGRSNEDNPQWGRTLRGY